MRPLLCVTLALLLLGSAAVSAEQLPRPAHGTFATSAQSK